MAAFEDTDPSTLTVRRTPLLGQEADDGVEAHLIVLVGHAMGRRYRMEGEVVLGRGPDSPVEIIDDGVSRRHAIIEPSPDGGYRIRDLDSRNGTFVNGRRVKESALRFGDKITVGSQTVFLFASRDRFEDQRIQGQKLQAIGQLAGGIAHDFNNLLGVVLANITHLQGLDQIDDGAARKCLGEVETAARRAVDLTNQLLAFARTSKRQHQPCDAGNLVEDATRLLRRTLHRSIAVDTQVEKGLTVIGDPSQMLQVIMNLCINAGDAMPGGGQLEIGVGAKTLGADPERTLPAGKYVAISVRDTGGGMTPEVRSRIFEPFFTTKPRGKGTGLGLATAFAIVRDHGGQIEVDSVPGQGTVFRVYLPAARVTSPVAGAANTEDKPLLVQGTVLLADDEDLVRYASKRVLGHAGIKVLTAKDGADALDVYAAHAGEIDLVILDLDMPRMDGAAAYHRLRQRCPSLRILISSGYVHAERERELREAGVDGFLHKPYDSMTLMGAIGRALRPSPADSKESQP